MPLPLYQKRDFQPVYTVSVESLHSCEKKNTTTPKPCHQQRLPKPLICHQGLGLDFQIYSRSQNHKFRAEEPWNIGSFTHIISPMLDPSQCGARVVVLYWNPRIYWKRSNTSMTEASKRHLEKIPNPREARMIKIITLINVLIHYKKCHYEHFLTLVIAGQGSEALITGYFFILGNINAGLEGVLLYIRTEILLRCFCYRTWAL